MAELSPRALALLRSQKERYLAGLPEKGRQLEALWELAADGQPGDFLDALHRLAGSAGLHGLDEIQALAARLETELKAHLGESGVYQAQVRELIGRLSAQR